MQSIYQQAYSYDKFGNRKLDQAQTWGTGINGSVAADIYDVDKPTNRLAGMVYDAAGNLVKSKPISPQPENRTYDAENRMTFAQLNGGTGYYVYDGDGRRVRRIANGVENWQVYGIDGELLAEYQWNGTTASLKKEYGYRDGQLLVVADPTETNANKRVQWLIADHLGTPRMVVDKTGSLSGVTRHDYLPFGEELMVGMGNGSIRSTGMGYQADSVRQKFTAYERDSETGLDFAQARYYATVQGRFTSPDPLLSSGKQEDPQSWNRYSYVGNRPTIFIDPTGLAWGYFTGNAGAWYKWFDDPADVEKNGGQLVGVNAGGPSAAHTYQAADGSWIRLELNENKWTSYETSTQAFYAQREFPTAMGDLGNTLNLFSGVQSIVGLGRIAFGRLFTGAASDASILSLPNSAATAELRFTQTTASSEFSANGLFSGKTIGQVASDLRSGVLSPSQVPVQVIEGEGVNLLVNTRSALSLMRAGIPRNQWNLVNVSGNAGVQANIGERLLRNGLTRQGTDVLRITGAGKTASSLR